jgi:hypothetical protein
METIFTVEKGENGCYLPSQSNDGKFIVTKDSEDEQYYNYTVKVKKSSFSPDVTTTENSSKNAENLPIAPLSLKTNAIEENNMNPQEIATAVTSSSTNSSQESSQKSSSTAYSSVPEISEEERKKMASVIAVAKVSENST